PGRGGPPRSPGGNWYYRRLRVPGVLPPLARLTLRQVRHLLRVSAVTAEPGPEHAGRGDRGAAVDAGGRGFRLRPGERVQQTHRPGRVVEPGRETRVDRWLRRSSPLRVLHAGE